ncbi:hypothetical protein [Vibrio sonorensis]|uniref:hypothetical protein n=1 Tax=Vibrio sonorensis TaxID=1004316 RepID=UPI0008D9C310|nr:hypothetical protein [Vibrio sonorensis]
MRQEYLNAIFSIVEKRGFITKADLIRNLNISNSCASKYLTTLTRIRVLSIERNAKSYSYFLIDGASTKKAVCPCCKEEKLIHRIKHAGGCLDCNGESSKKKDSGFAPPISCLPLT